MNLPVLIASGARNLFRCQRRRAFARRSGRKPALLAISLMIAPTLPAQPNLPHIGYVYPAGGRQGATFQVAVGGQYLGSVSNIYITGAGARGRVLEYNRPLTQKEFNDLRDQLTELHSRRRAAIQSARKHEGQTGAPASTNVWTVADEYRMAAIRSKIVKNPPNRQGNPAIAETITVQVALGTNAEPGEREIRLATPNGLSNPLTFRVGELPEVSRPATQSANPDLDRLLERLGQKPAGTVRPELRITLPATVNGQILPGGADRYRFQARQGQRLVVAVSARELIPYLADAVPGWFQAALSLYDAQGQELAFADHFRFHPDPGLCFEVPRDGAYVIQIRDSLYRGREDFVYRITLGELPLLTSLFPLGGPAQAPTTVEFTGWNLPAATLTQTNPGPGVHPVSVASKGRSSNPLPFAVDTLPECREQEPNNTPDCAQPVTLPVIINGRIDQPGDRDVFRFEGRAGDELVAEVHARRLGSPLDSVLKLTDATGRQLAFNDDYEDQGAGLDTHYADSCFRATLSTNGTCYLHLSDAQHQGGPEYAYRLRISPPRPDFELRIVPSSLNVRGGAAVPFTVCALRRDGFSGEITLELKDAPAGFALSGGCLPANQDRVRLTLTAPPTPMPEPLSLSLEGRAKIQGREVIRPGVPADDRMQAFAYRHLVPAKELQVAVSPGFKIRSALKIVDGLPLKLPAGGTGRVEVATPGRRFMDRVEFELSEPPDGITIRQVAPSARGVEIVLQSDAAKSRPGLKGNLIVEIMPTRSPNDSPKGKARGNQRRAALGALPAIPFEIVNP